VSELLTRTGVVKALQGRMAVVVTAMEEECEDCKAKDACFTMGGGGANAEVKVLNTARAEVGDRVTISIKGSSLLKVSFLVYMLPILALIGGVIVGHYLSAFIPVDENILVGVLGLLAFCGTFVWLRKKGDRLATEKQFMPEIVSRKKARQPVTPADVTCPGK
jgi:sigma-E factor negative regulatory protein RseC